MADRSKELFQDLVARIRSGKTASLPIPDPNLFGKNPPTSFNVRACYGPQPFKTDTIIIDYEPPPVHASGKDVFDHHRSAAHLLTCELLRMFTNGFLTRDGALFVEQGVYGRVTRIERDTTPDDFWQYSNVVYDSHFFGNGHQRVEGNYPLIHSLVTDLSSLKNPIRRENGKEIFEPNIPIYGIDCPESYAQLRSLLHTVGTLPGPKPSESDCQKFYRRAYDMARIASELLKGHPHALFVVSPAVSNAWEQPLLKRGLSPMSTYFKDRSVVVLSPVDTPLVQGIYPDERLDRR